MLAFACYDIEYAGMYLCEHVMILYWQVYELIIKSNSTTVKHTACHGTFMGRVTGKCQMELT